MTYIADQFALLGEHFGLILIGCAELVVAVILFWLFFSHKKEKEKKIISRGETGIFLKEFDRQTDEGCLIIRKKDMYPVFGAGNLQKLIGVDLSDLQEDITAIFRCAREKKEGRKNWDKYMTWNGESTFSAEMQTEEGDWLRLIVRQSEDGCYDLVRIYRTTEIHKKDEDYEQRLSETEEVSQSKTTFLSRMSHEIRTPMNGIIGMLTLAEGKLAPDHPAMQYLSKADELSDHLLALINDILDMSRIEAGKVELEKKPFSLRELGDRLYDMFARNLEARGISYAVNFEDMTVDYVIGDELRISQIIINFLSNAVKFTSEGEITVTFRQMLVQDNMADMMVRVHDTGIGMKPEFVNRIFRPFEQESIETSKQYGGTGLGMAITDQLVKLMGGEIVVDSLQGRGSDFTVFLHLPVADEAVEGKQTTADLTETEKQKENAFRGCRILMAEDNEINAMIAVEILGEMGAEVEVAGNGQIAVDKFAEHPAGYYDFILMDVQMPVMDGRTAARTIRALNRKDAGSILIFALSADAFVEDERLSRESGMNAHYAKPLNFEELQNNIGVFLRERRQA